VSSRSSSSPNFNFNGLPGGSEKGGGDRIGPALQWLGEHVLLVAAIAAGVIALVLALAAIVAWVNSRGTFVYLDNVATSRAEIARPWKEHAGRAGSYFVWQLGLSVAALMVMLAVLVPIGWAGLRIVRSSADTVTFVVLVLAVLTAAVALTLVSLLAMALRDFVAPLQWFRDLSCGAAIRTFLGILRANPLLFLVYVVLKIVFAMVVAMVSVAACCLICCIGMIPVAYQALLQPFFYFERRWSLELLDQLGYGPPESFAEPPALVRPAPEAPPDPEPAGPDLVTG